MKKSSLDIAGLVGLPSRYGLPNKAWDGLLGLDVESGLDPVLEEWANRPMKVDVSDELREFLIGIGADPDLPVTQDVLAEIDRQIIDLGGDPDADE